MNALTEVKAGGAIAPMPTVQKHRAALAPTTSWKEDKDGRTVDCVDWTIRVDGYTRLIPEAECKAVMAEVEAGLMPAGRKTAANQAEVLVGSYPAREVNNADVYVRAIASVFETAPPDIGKEAVDHITRHLRFLPTRADVHDVVVKLVGERKHAARVAEAHLKEHARRAKAREEAERKKAFDAKWGEALRAWMTIPISVRMPWDAFQKLWAETPPEKRADLTKPPEPPATEEAPHVED